jgi:hypothetical protein
MRNTSRLLSVTTFFALSTASFSGAADRASFASSLLAPSSALAAPSGRATTAGDFDLDGQPDLLWQHPLRGSLEVWVMDGVKPVRRVRLDAATGDPHLFAVGTDDFNGDGMTDILFWRDDTGEVQIWYVQDFKVVARVALEDRIPDFTPVSIYDFDRDGDPDILWQSKTGQILMTLVKDSTLVEKIEIEIASSGPSLENQWVVRGSGDFDSDGDNDLLLDRWPNPATTQLSSRVVALARMDGSRGLVEPIAVQPDLNWRIGAVQDYDNDGDPDLVWENDFARVTGIWRMAGTKVHEALLVTGPGTLQESGDIVGPR